MDLKKSQIPDLNSQRDSPDDYCRAIESYLCRKNDGHLIRIVGPSFEKVCGWVERGVPIKVAFRGIDRYFERYYAKGPRRRPVRVDFCEADVLDVFDEWRRAVGVGTDLEKVGPDDGRGGIHRRHESLPAHLERIVARLATLRSGNDRSLEPLLDAVVREVEAARATARNLRGAPSTALLSRLAALDAQLIAAARERLTTDARAALRREAEAELAPFRARMPTKAYEESLAACMDRLVRDRSRLPVVAFE